VQSIGKVEQGVVEAIAKEEYEEWLSIRDAILYIQGIYGLTINRVTLLTLAHKFNFVKKEKDYFLQLGPLREAFELSYFPEIPKGWKSIYTLSAIYSVNANMILLWIYHKKVLGTKFHVGTKEVYFAKEETVKRYINKRKSRGIGEGRGAILGRKHFKCRKRSGSLLD
jgi:hypothetical protein